MNNYINTKQNASATATKEATSQVVEGVYLCNNDLGGTQWTPMRIDPGFIDILGLHGAVVDLEESTDDAQYNHIYVEISKETFNKSVDYGISILSLPRKLNKNELHRITNSGFHFLGCDLQEEYPDCFVSLPLIIGGEEEQLLISLFECLRRYRIMKVLRCLLTQPERKKYSDEIDKWCEQGLADVRKFEGILDSN